MGNLANQYLKMMLHTQIVPGFVKEMDEKVPGAIDDFIADDIRVEKASESDKEVESVKDKDESKNGASKPK